MDKARDIFAQGIFYLAARFSMYRKINPPAHKLERKGCFRSDMKIKSSRWVHTHANTAQSLNRIERMKNIQGTWETKPIAVFWVP